VNLEVRQTVLPNGIRVATCPAPHVSSAAMGVWVGIGGRHEPERLCGVSHFIEHLLFKGTRTRSARDISQAIEGRGGYFNAFTQEEFTCYYARVGFDHAWRVLDILADMYRHPRFDPEDIEKERGVILEEMMMYKDRPDQLVQDMLTESLWPGHPLGRPLVGLEKTLRAMRRSHLLDFKRRRYVPANTILTFAGRVEHETCVRQTAARLGGMARAPAPVFRPAPRGPARGRIALRKKTLEQTQLALGFRLFGRHDPRRYPLKVLNVILGENMSSRLFQVIREKHGLAYSIHSSFHLLADTGALVVSAGLDRAAGPRALGLILRELRRFKEDLPGSRELRRAKDYIVGQMRLGLESPSSCMMWVGENLLAYGRVLSPQSIMDAVEAVTARDVRDVAGQVLDPRRLSLAIVSPETGPGDEPAWAARLGGL
jgi:predicted Zn-dependent peptidase